MTDDVTILFTFSAFQKYSTIMSSLSIDPLFQTIYPLFYITMGFECVLELLISSTYEVVDGLMYVD